MSTSENTPSGFDPGYPASTVFGVVDSPQNVNDAVAALRRAHVDSENIEIIYNELAKQQIEEFEEAHPVAARVVKFIVVTGEEAEEWSTYNHLLNERRYLIRVPVENREQAEQVASVLTNAGGYFVNYFAPLTVERLAP